MPCYRIRRGRVEPEAGCLLCGDGEGKIDVAPAVLMVVDADPSESHSLAIADERGCLPKRQTNWHPDVYSQAQEPILTRGDCNSESAFKQARGIGLR